MDYNKIKWTPAQKIFQSLRVIKEFEDRTESNDLVQDQFDVIEKVRKILKS